MKTAIRILVNLGIDILWLYVFSQIGWITIVSNSGQADLILTMTMIALISSGVGLVYFFAWKILSQLSCGLGCFLYPIYTISYGWACLWGVAMFTPLMGINVNFWWQGLVMSLVYGGLRIQEIQMSSSSTTFRFPSLD